MGQLGIKINGHDYQIACDDGEEEHLTCLSEYVDKHVSDLADSVGGVGETRLLLMAALVIADELSDSLGRGEALEGEISALKKGGGGADGPSAAGILEAAAIRLESIAARFETS
jgi:cell division protein ZapA